MTGLNSQESESGKSIHTHTHTHTTNPSIIGRFISVYKLWDGIRNNFPKKSRYTLGAKIDNLFLETIEYLFIASTLARGKKLAVLQRASARFDLLKFFLQLVWELKALDTKTYAALSEPLNGIGKMLGGWMKNAEKETSPA